MPPLPLRERLEAIAGERATAEKLLRDVRLDTGKALVEVAATEDITMTEAATILGISRPTAYLLLEDAKEAG